ncbi:oligosaccharide flippase family protein [Acidimangrovimonas pyrenivorans]|uniref:Polysaccharide biosynthesis C-terminal domain-containing protein n=1 Tax=Acidimangrovimonas pyrenivorans TaxID=2030798 RepID=A0ABV7AN83_9RHOB
MASFARRILSFGAISIVQKLLGFLISVQIVAVLGASQFGVYAFILNVVNTVAMFVLFGFPQTLTRQIAVYLEWEQTDLVRGLLKFSSLALAGTTLLSISVWLFGCQLYCAPDPTGATAKAGLILLPLVVLLGVQQAIMRGLDRVIDAVWPVMLLQPALFLGGLTWARSLHLHAQASEAMIWLILTNLVAALALGLLFWRHHPLRGNERPRYAYGTWARSLLPFFLIGGMNLLLQRTDILVIGVFRAHTEVAQYAIASQLAMVLFLPVGIVNSSIEPRIAAAFSRKQNERLHKLYADCALWTTGVALLGLLALGAFGKMMLVNVFGPEFISSYPAMLILASGYAISVAFGSSGSFLSMAGHEKMTLTGTATATGLNIVLNLLLVPTFGLKGAAIATFLSMVTAKLINAAFLFRALHILPGPLWHLTDQGKRLQHPNKDLP